MLIKPECIAVVGLGKLGTSIAACFASRGYIIIGIDVNRGILDLIDEGKSPFIETNLQKLISKYRKRFNTSQDYEEAISDSNITFIITPTPSEPDGNFSDRYVREALIPLAKSLRKSSKKNHLFVIVSTLSPGTTNNNLIPLIEEASGKKLNRDFSICYNPAFIALGSVINDFLNPNLVLIGESDKSAGDKLVKFYKKVHINKPYIARMSIISAEIAKLSVNAYVTMKISFANTLANICERIPDADIDAITKALGEDKRIAPYYLKGGLAFGGPCFPRDNKAFVSFTEKYGCKAKLAEATDWINDFQIQHLKEIVLRYFSIIKEKKVSIMGLAYKHDTPIIEESAAVKLIDVLLKEGADITVYDPLAIKNVKTLYADKISYAASVKECISRSHLWILTAPLKEFKAIDQTYITYSPTVIIDCWRIVEQERLGNMAKYVALGKFQT